MKILVTGASSYAGAAIYQALKSNFDVVGTYNSNQLFPELQLLDIADKEKVRGLVSLVKPDVIVHAAANASASWCEKNPELAVAINQEGTRNIVEAANELESRVIFISSMAVASDSLYGRTKVKSEEYVKQTRAGYVILRPSLIIGLSPNTENDRPFNRLLKNITENTPAVYDTSWKFQPTWLRHLNEVVEETIRRQISGEIIPVSVPELKTRFDIARDLLSDFGIKAVPEDKQSTEPVLLDDLIKLRSLHLPVYSYKEMIEGIKAEIRDYLNSLK